MRKRKYDGVLRKIVISNTRYYREQAKMTQEELSLKLKRKENFIERLENGETKLEPTLVTVDEIAEVLEIPTEYLVMERKKENE